MLSAARNLMQILTTIAGLALFASMPLPALAQVHYEDGRPWSHKADEGPDAEVGGWYYNLGITGIRAMLMKDQPTWLLVKYVFPKTVAYGRIQAGDVIIGANGKRFLTPHKNGYGEEVFGGDGPLKDLGQALEASQGKKRRGLLTLHVRRKGKVVPVKLKVGRRYGRYAKAFPFDCKKSALILKELCWYIAKQQDEEGSWGPAHLNTFAPLALLASGDRRYLPHVKKSVQFHAKRTKAVDAIDGLVNWRYNAAAIVMSEYYLATREKWILGELQQIYNFLLSSQYTVADQIRDSARERKLPRSEMQGIGGWGHNPGYEGYGPIAMVTGQGALALALMKRCGIKVSRRRHDMAYDFLARGTGKNGYLWYADSVAKQDGWADMGRTGAAALANFMSPYPQAKYKNWALAQARAIGAHPETLPDTHASPMMGMVYTALGAFIDKASFRRLMDSNRWWFTLAQCPGGSFYYQPNRDNNAQDFGRRSRLSSSSTVALIFAAKNRNLRITGAKAK